MRHPDSVDAGLVVLAGDYLHAAHVEGAFRSGQPVAERLLRRL
jgi:predicted NAD/FAD-dependent oxidoreductase